MVSIAYLLIRYFCPLSSVSKFVLARVSDARYCLFIIKDFLYYFNRYSWMNQYVAKCAKNASPTLAIWNVTCCCTQAKNPSNAPFARRNSRKNPIWRIMLLNSTTSHCSTSDHSKRKLSMNQSTNKIMSIFRVICKKVNLLPKTQSPVNTAARFFDTKVLTWSMWWWRTAISLRQLQP